MLEAAETSASLSQKEYKKIVPDLRTRLIEMQQNLRTAPFPLIIVISGDDPAGARALLNLMSEWMDARFIVTRVFAEPTGDEQSRPPAWRYWMELPAHGRVAVFSDEWTTHQLALRLRGKITSAQLDAALDACVRFERMLAADGALFVKLFVHQPAAQLADQRKFINKSASTNSVSAIARALLKHPDKARKTIETTLARTSIAGAPWNLIDGSSSRHRDVDAARILLDAATAHLERTSASTPEQPATRGTIKVASGSVLDSVDLDKSLSGSAYDERMAELSPRLARLTARAAKKGISVVAAFEGWDAAGKGGTIRRLTATMNPEQYRNISIAAPSDEEKAHHYLWRFWRHLPRAGGFTIFDRSWYGRVLVERVEGFASPDEWQRAYEEISYFEQSLISSGIVLLKFWLHIDKDEQLSRFKDREKTPYKRHKIGPEDYRNRKQWDSYVHAVDDMVARTSTPDAPWHLIAHNDKKFGRIRVLETVADALEARLK